MAPRSSTATETYDASEMCDRSKRPHTSTSTATCTSTSTEMEICEDSRSHGSEESCSTIDILLPAVMLVEILSRVCSAKDLINCFAVSPGFRSAFVEVKTIHFTCKLEDVRKGRLREPFKQIVTKTLQKMDCVEQLRLEVEDEMQGKKVKEDGIEPQSMWLSQDNFVEEWLFHVRITLRKLTVIDYGQQAIYKKSFILQRLSADCKQLQTLELRNMFVSTKDVKPMPKITTLTLRCVKLPDSGLKVLNQCMPNLETLTLVTVVGLKEAEFESSILKVLCLGLATRVKSVRLIVESLEKLQLKMPGPDKLFVRAPKLRCLAMCMDRRDSRATVVFEKVESLRELLMGALEFSMLNTLCKANCNLEKMFLDVPCLAFLDSGKWSAVLNTVPLDVPDMDSIRSCCPNLSTLSVGPGLWYALEDVSSRKDVVTNWPALKRLIVHMIVLPSKEHSMAVTLLFDIVKGIRSLSTLEVYVHVDSVTEAKAFSKLGQWLPHLNVKCDTWKKGLKFDCFSF